MSFAEYLRRLESINPQLADGQRRLSLTVDSLVRQLQKAYAAGAQDAEERQLAAEDFAAQRNPAADFSDLLGGFFT